MTSDGILKITNQVQIRGAVEKTYAVALDLSELSQEYQSMLDNNFGDAYMQAFLQYVLGFTELFREYCNREDINITRDKSGFSLTHLFVTDEELEKLISNLRKDISPYDDNNSADGRKLRSIGIIVSPPHKE